MDKSICSGNGSKRWVRALIFWDLRLVNLAIWLLRENLSPLVCAWPIFPMLAKEMRDACRDGDWNTAVIAAMNVLQTLQQRGFTEKQTGVELVLHKICL